MSSKDGIRWFLHDQGNVKLSKMQGGLLSNMG